MTDTDPNRGTGRTQRMLDKVAESLSVPNRRLYVFVHSSMYARDLLSRFAHMPNVAALSPIKVPNQTVARFPSGTTVRFLAATDEGRRDMRGLPDGLVFEDHHVAEVNLERSTQSRSVRESNIKPAPPPVPDGALRVAKYSSPTGQGAATRTHG